MSNFSKIDSLVKKNIFGKKLLINFTKDPILHLILINLPLKTHTIRPPTLLYKIKKYLYIIIALIDFMILSPLVKFQQ
jgi:hypothetical protein